MTAPFRNFVSPHVHVQSLDSASTPQAFVERELELGTGALTCTDHGSMAACSDVYELAKKNKLIPILGIEGYMRDDNDEILIKAGIPKDEKGTFSSFCKYYHVTLNAQDQEGYEALVRAVSRADLRAETHGSERKPLFTWNDLAEIGQYNVTVGTGCLVGLVQRPLHGENPRPDIAEQFYLKLKSLFKPGNLYVEVFPHKCDHNWVSGVFMTLEGGKQLKYWKGKQFKTDAGEGTGEDLAKMVSRGIQLGRLLAIKNYRTWEEVEPKTIVDVKVVSDFIKNECTVTAPDGDIQLGANRFVLEMAQKYGDKVLISGDEHYAYPEDHVIQDIRLGGVNGNWRFYETYARYSSEQVWEYFKNVLNVPQKQFEEWIDNSHEFASKFKDFKFKPRRALPNKFYPEDTLGHLKYLIDKVGRMDWSSEVWCDRLGSEIELLYGNGTIDLLPYFFLANEIRSHYESLRHLGGPGRGSAGGCAIAYLLGITDVDPIRYGLSKDRFLTIDRIASGKLPDIDLDFGNREVLVDPEKGFLYKRFGECVASISTNTMLRLKSSIKDVERALEGEVSFAIEGMCKKIPNPPQGVEDKSWLFGYHSEDGKEVKGYWDTPEAKDLREYAEKNPKKWDLVLRCLSLTRNKSKHACAMIIADEPISNFIPLVTINGVRATQYDAPGVEARGGLKMDILGLNSLLDIEQAIDLIQQRNGGLIKEDMQLGGKRVPGFRVVPYEGKSYDIWDLPEDQEVFNDIVEGRTETVFQFSTNSAKQWLKVFNHNKKGTNNKIIDSVLAMAVFTALDRPGPLDAMVKDRDGKVHNMVIEYANRAQGKPAVDEIPFLNEIIPESYGVLCFQEQVEKVYRACTGCDGIEASNFRTLLAKKKMDKVEASYPKFMERAIPRIGEEQAKKIWAQTCTFGQYGFCFSHAVEYAVIAYACAFLKHYYPLEWWCSVLNNADKNEISEKFWRHCKHWVDMPDIRYSGDKWQIQDGRIRAPIGLLHGIGPKAHDELCAGRPYTNIQSLTDHIANTKKSRAKVSEKTGKMKAGTSALNKGVMSKLIVSGVADSLFEPNLTVYEKLDAYEKALATSLNKKKAGKPDQVYNNFTALSLYQYKKDILPVYAQDLLPILHQTQIHGVVEEPKRQFSYKYIPTDPLIVKDIQVQKKDNHDLEALPMVTGAQLKYLNEDIQIYDGQLVVCAAAGYILEERPFSFKKENKTKHAVELVLDVEGEQFKLVKWAPKGETKPVLPKDLKGSVVIAMVSRYRSDRPFCLDALYVVAKPLGEVEEESSE